MASKRSSTTHQKYIKPKALRKRKGDRDRDRDEDGVCLQLF